MSEQIEKYIGNSGKIETADLDWEQARAAGLTEDERFALAYFSDIESQTIRYLRTLLQMRTAFQPAVSAFLTTWSYEEFFHGYFLARLMAVCGYPLEDGRVEQVKQRARLNERIESVFAPLLSRVFSRQFPAVYMSFGAIQEMTTLRGYESIARSTANPVLKVLCERIAKQERRHFAWYFNSAKQYLAESKSAQTLTRMLLRLNWVPVGAGVKSRAEVERLFSILFPAERGHALIREVDEKIGTLPGLEGIRLMQSYFAKLHPHRARSLAHPQPAILPLLTPDS
ncbi:MAG TPA: acyl-ACP desaturase [Blastocatellia bacterium]|nr:acyl-ACP desaturase [Blastocatellia bacterium]